jgi:hypothetical protein
VGPRGTVTGWAVVGVSVAGLLVGPGGGSEIAAAGLSGNVALTTLPTRSCAGGCVVVPRTLTISDGSGPHKKFDCTFNNATEAFTGAYGTASAIGWEGNYRGVVTCLGGTFYVQDGINKNFGFGIYNGEETAWSDADGYLPAQITSFDRSGAIVSITEFADRLTIGGNAYVAVYSQVAIANTTDRTIEAEPEPSTGMVVLSAPPDKVKPHTVAIHQYVVAVDRFGKHYRWPSAAQLAAAGSYAQHYTNMSRFWKGQLSEISQIEVPDPSLVDAYRAGFIYTEIARSGDDLNTGVNGYESEFSHDVIGILTNMFTQGYYSDAQALLLNDRNVVGSSGQYDDGIWTYSWPWAVYLMKTGDLAFVKANFWKEGPEGKLQPSIEDTAHLIGKAMTGPGGIIEATDDIDSNGYWTVDDFEALMGLAAYRYIATRVGATPQVKWATSEYDALLAATNKTLDATISRYHLDYLPCSMVRPNTDNVCSKPENANWAATFQFGKWAWDAQLLGATVDGPGISLIDATYDYGFGRLKGKLPANTFGGYPSDYYFSTGYNAGYGTWGLASTDHRDQGIMSYEFMIADDQSGPYSWWESSLDPASSLWVGRHPAGGQGSSPHAWGISEANLVLLDSLLTQESDGDVIVGRGVPAGWLAPGGRISVNNFPTTDNKRLNMRIISSGQAVTLGLTGMPPSGSILFELPSFVENIASVSSGTIDEQTGTVTLPSDTTTVTVTLKTAQATATRAG